MSRGMTTGGVLVRGVAFALVWLLIGYQTYVVLRSPDETTAATPTVVDSLILFTAGEQCEVAIKAQLTAPATAQFVGRQTWVAADGAVQVTGAVAARNQHGAREFADWACRYHPDTDHAVVAGGRI